jgi:DHA3 family macrolide efflux protein-like MFS transporter
MSMNSEPMTPSEAPGIDSPSGRRWQPPFFSIWAGQAISLIGSRALDFALVWWLTQLTGSATVLATATLAIIVPQVILGPLIGAYVDRWNRRLVMILSDTFVALVSLWMAYLFWSDSVALWHIYVAGFVRTVAGLFQWPAMQASTTLMVPEKHLTRVAGLNQTMQGALNVIGPPLGALLLAMLPFQSIMLMDVGTALLAVVPLLFVRIPQPKAAEVEVGGRTSVWADLREGMQYVLNWPGLTAIILMAMLLNFVMNPAFTLMPLLVTDHFDGGALQLSYLEAAWGIGLVLGGLLLAAWGGFRRKIYTSLVALAVEGVATALVGAASAGLLGLAIGSMFVMGMMNALVNGPLFALLQRVVSPDKQGRVFNLVASLTSAAWPLSLAVAGPIADAVGVRPWFIVGGIVCTLTAVASFFVPAIINLEENGHGPGVDASSGGVQTGS